MRWLVRIVQKNRRNLKGFGCMRDLKGDCNDWKLWKSKIEEKTTTKPEIVSLIVGVIAGVFGDVFDPSFLGKNF